MAEKNIIQFTPKRSAGKRDDISVKIYLEDYQKICEISSLTNIPKIEVIGKFLSQPYEILDREKKKD